MQNAARKGVEMRRICPTLEEAVQTACRMLKQEARPEGLTIEAQHVVLDPLQRDRRERLAHCQWMTESQGEVKTKVMLPICSSCWSPTG